LPANGIPDNIIGHARNHAIEKTLDPTATYVPEANMEEEKQADPTPANIAVQVKYI
jgi:hypothetical protein